MTDFEKAIAFVFEAEGLASNLKGDPGGKTCIGIASAYFPAEYAVIMALPENERLGYAKNFYFSNFWIKYRCDIRPWPCNLVYLDAAINCGPSRASQFALGNVDDYISALCKRMRWQINESKSPYTVSLLNRMYRLLQLAKG